MRPTCLQPASGQATGHTLRGCIPCTIGEASPYHCSMHPPTVHPCKPSPQMLHCSPSLPFWPGCSALPHLLGWAQAVKARGGRKQSRNLQQPEQLENNVQAGAQELPFNHLWVACSLWATSWTALDLRISSTKSKCFLHLESIK